MPESKDDHDTLIRVEAKLENLMGDVKNIRDNMASRDSVERAHKRIDTLQKYLIGVAAFGAVEAFAIIKMLLIDKG